jgi:multidrug efflux system membrane fusion protein
MRTSGRSLEVPRPTTAAVPGLPGAAALLGAAWLIASSGCDGAAGPGGPPAEGAPVAVRVATVAQRDVSVTLRAIGTAEAYQTVTVRPRVEGQLIDVAFREGQEVQAGEILFRIDPRPFEAALHLAQAQLAKNQAMLADAQHEAQRIAGLFERQAASERERSSAQALADATLAQVQADQAAVEQARLDLEFCTITAPINGRVGARLVDRGNVVKAHDTALVVIHQIDPIYIGFSLAEQHLPAVQRRLATETLRVAVRDTDASETPETGALTFVDNQVDRTTGMFRLKAEFANTEHRLWPGQFVRVALLLDERPGAVVAPPQAVQVGPEGAFAFVLDRDGTVEMRTVRRGEALDEGVLIEAGLRAGETVVTDGHLRLRPGARVEVIQDGARPATTPSAGTLEASAAPRATGRSEP